MERHIREAEGKSARVILQELMTENFKEGIISRVQCCRKQW
jgi:hypothetical protein